MQPKFVGLRFISLQMLMLFVSLLECVATANTPPLNPPDKRITQISFDQAVKMVTDSPAVQLAAGQLTLAQHQFGEASAFVSGGLSAGYTRSSGGGGGEGGPLDAGGLEPITATATFNVVPYGEAADSARQARWGVQLAEAMLEATEAANVVVVVTQYLDALRYSQEEAALIAATEVARTALAAARTRLEVGAANTADLLASEIALSQAQNDLAEIALERDQALASLSQTLGVSVAAVEGEPPRITLPDLGDTDARFETRSDVLSARLEVLSAELNRSAALRSVLPTGSAGVGYRDGSVALGAGFGTDTFQPSLEASYDPDGSLDDPTGAGLRAQFSVTIPLDSGSGASLAAAEAAEANARLELEQTLAQADLDLQATQNQLVTTQNSLTAAGALVEQRQQSLETTRTRLELGLVPAYEVESAEASLLGAQVQLKRLEDNVLLAQLILLQTLGMNPLAVL